ncbi:MAG: hypothetical protein ABIK93_03975 [candidate division WOR-3 bacterium]
MTFCQPIYMIKGLVLNYEKISNQENLNSNFLIVNSFNYEWNE